MEAVFWQRVVLLAGQLLFLPFRSNNPLTNLMNRDSKPITILMADDDEDDRRLTQEAFEEGRLINDVRYVEHGEELMDYLRKEGKYASPAEAQRPGLILLDLNMPRKDGRTVLKEIKSDPDLRQIPVVVLTTSKADEDVYKSYDLGVNSYIVKPVTFEALVDILQTLEKYWFEIVELPPPRDEARD
jgi:CheY-like chemotaxis protein